MQDQQSRDENRGEISPVKGLVHSLQVMQAGFHQSGTLICPLTRLLSLAESLADCSSVMSVPVSLLQIVMLAMHSFTSVILVRKVGIASPRLPNGIIKNSELHQIRIT